MIRRRSPVAASLLLVLCACTSDEEQIAAPEIEPLISSLPTRCGSLGQAPAAGEVTFLVGDRLFAALPDGSDTRCIARLSEAGGLTWGGEADRVATSTSAGDLVLTGGERELLQPPEIEPEFHGLTRPTGTSLVYISADHKRLFKVPLGGGGPEDISFLKRHDEVAYHPSGTSVIVVGSNRDGAYGLFFATNEGAKAQLLAIAEDARRIYSLAFSHDGRTIYYAAEHDDRYDLHSLALTSPGSAGSSDAIAEGRLKTLHQSQQPIDNVVVSEFSKNPPVAFTEGTCDTGIEAAVWNGESVEQVRTSGADDFTTPVGWLPDATLALTNSGGACGEGPGTVWLWHGGETEPLVSGVGDAAVRAQFPPPPRPLIPAEGVVP